jgi:hypothetical protein
MEQARRDLFLAAVLTGLLTHESPLGIKARASVIANDALAVVDAIEEQMNKRLAALTAEDYVR